MKDIADELYKRLVETFDKFLADTPTQVHEAASAIGRLFAETLIENGVEMDNAIANIENLKNYIIEGLMEEDNGRTIH